ncbi:MAG TPA: hypothetical protein VFH68_15415 [Polyangia bacterium]|jgi:hypothetical protein|nr:hypothetical protein [Polyangia bacterium]
MRPRLLVFALLALASFASMGARASLAGPAGAAAAPSVTPAATGTQRVVLIDAGGQRAMEISQHGESLRIATTKGEPALLGELHGPGKRKYRLEGPAGAPVAEVKLKGAPGGADAGGFKLRSPDGRLLWKVKIAGDKIKISADEEGTHPFVLSLKQDDKVKVTGGDERALGAVHYRAGKRISVEDAAGHEVYAADGDQRSALFGVLLLDAIPGRERQILMAEILAAGF